LKLNKKHQGKEFKSFFKFVGQVKQTITGTSDDFKVIPIYQTTMTNPKDPDKKPKPRRVLRFDIFTNKFNNISIQRAGMEFPKAQLYSSTDKKSAAIDWKDRFDKEKYPAKHYHMIETDWDFCARVADEIKENDWVEVKGKYEFDKFVNEEGQEYPVIKRIISSVEVIENEQEFKIGKNTIKYICDFEDPDFTEINYFNLEIGINSVYQDEETKDTTINGIFLDYGKEKSTPKEVKLICLYKEPENNKTALADAIAQMNKYDFIEFVGVDNNRPVFAEVEDDTDSVDDLFSDVDEIVAKTRRVISGNKKGLEVTAVVNKTYQKQMLTEAEIGMTVEQQFNGVVVDDEDDIPFNLDDD
jgi:hypothetical protein